MYNPATLEVVGEVDVCEPDSLPAMRKKASEAQAVWTAIPLAQRKKVIERAQEIIFEQREEIASIICQETGKPKMEAINADIGCALGRRRLLHEGDGTDLPSYKIDFGSMGLSMRYLRRSSYIVPKPIGVVGIIAPWNYPFGMPYSQTVMAISRGERGSAQAVLAHSVQCDEDRRDLGAGRRPKGLVQVVIGRGNEIGRAFTRCGLDRIIFTGGAEAGRKVMENACQRFTPVTLELGGKDPFLVMDDADMARAVEGGRLGRVRQLRPDLLQRQEDIRSERGLFRVHRAVVERVRSLKQGWGWEDPRSPSVR